MNRLPLFGLFLVMLGSCEKKTTQTKVETVRLITLDPGHFHAALVQKSMYPGVDSTVHVYAPAGSDLNLHLERINGYNRRQENPTAWRETVYAGNDFLKKMISEKSGNVVVLSGNNQQKTDYILKALENGFHVLADKPLVIDGAGFEKLKTAFSIAEKNKLLLYDIMTERFEITTTLQREFSMIPDIFGELEKGSPENPSITKESVHHFYKYVSESVLTRPAWFMDVNQQGEGIVDVMSHLVDLVQWECFPEQALDYTKDIQILSARRWSTQMTFDQFKTITKLDSIPSYLNGVVHPENVLNVSCNGEINFQVKGIFAKTSVVWNYQAPEGTGDTHFSMMRGTRANLIIRQGKDEDYQPTLYIVPHIKDKGFELKLKDAVREIQKKYPGVVVRENGSDWEVVIPEKFKENHEAHFARVTQNYMNYFYGEPMPTWEVPNMLAKYYTTTKGLELAVKGQ